MAKRNLRPALALIVVLAVSAFAAGQDLSSDPQVLVAASQNFTRLYRAKQYAEALQAADETIALARKARQPATVAAMLYNKACVLALMGRATDAVAAARAAVAEGYSDYLQFAGDSDFDSLRGDAEFRALMTELRAKHGPKPLNWDRARTVARFPITFDDPANPRLAEMRREFAIDDAVAGLEDEYAKLRALTAWASRQWQHSPTNMASKPDPVTILGEAKAGGRFICRDYAIVVAGVARAYGMPARVLNLLPADVETRSEAHSVAEIWLARFDKWVLADGQYGTIAEVNGVPLNGVELQAAIARADPGLRCSAGREACSLWQAFIVRNMHYFKFAQDQRRFDQQRGAPQLVLVPSGSADPRKFAGGNEEVFAGAVYISDPAVFYAPPAATGKR